MTDHHPRDQELNRDVARLDAQYTETDSPDVADAPTREDYERAKIDLVEACLEDGPTDALEQAVDAYVDALEPKLVEKEGEVHDMRRRWWDTKRALDDSEAKLDEARGLLEEFWSECDSEDGTISEDDRVQPWIEGELARARIFLGQT